MAESYPEWKVRTWRAVRAMMAAGLTSMAVVRPDLTDWQETSRVLIAAFLAGVLTWLAKYIRDVWGQENKTGMLNRLPL